MVRLDAVGIAAFLWGVADVRAAALAGSWHLDNIATLVSERLDPVVVPNGVAPHMHRVNGGSAFSSYYNFAEYSSSACSSNAVQADKSAYWAPQLYWINSNGSSFTPIGSARTRFYYFNSGSTTNDTVVPFPEGLRMVAGDPANKVGNKNILTYGCHIHADYSDMLGADNFNFQSPCPYGLKTDLTFPSCWDGFNLYKPDNSHVAYPAGSRDGACPISHPISIPTIMLEYTWDVGQWDSTSNLAGKLAWANGDTTGYGMHADFANGWDTATLQAALSSPACMQTGVAAMPFQDCPILAATFDWDAAQKCKPDKGVLSDGLASVDFVPVQKLPGCNPLWGATGSKPTCNPMPANPSIAGFTGTQESLVAPASAQVGFVWPNKPGWKSYACINGYNALANLTYYTDPNLTLDKCQSTCLASDRSFAALSLTGNTWTCACGTDLPTSTYIQTGSCYTTCPEGKGLLCGQNANFQIYVAGPGTTSSTLSGVGPYMGCYRNPSSSSSGLLGRSTYSFSSQSMTTDMCLSGCKDVSATWAMTGNGGSYCYCGTSYAADGGIYGADASCNIPCPGNKTQMCGSWSTYSVYNVTKAGYQGSTRSDKPSGRVGCYAQSAGLSALADNGWTSPVLTPAACINGCSELGYSLAALQAGSKCSCGNKFTGGQWLPDSVCQQPCVGNSSLTCGGTQQSNNLELYNTSFATVTMDTQAASHPAGWFGCFRDRSPTTLSYNYTYTSNTVKADTCRSACASFGYDYAFTTSGSICKCSSIAPTTTQFVAANCTQTCAGNSSQTCGSNGFADVYYVDGSTGPSGHQHPALQGCFTDPKGQGMIDYVTAGSNTTPQTCMSYCKELGYALAGVEDGDECHCSNSFTAGQVMPSTACTAQCAGNATQTCGGYQLLNLYNATFGASIADKSPGWLGCYTDGWARTFTGYNYSAPTMSSTVCRVACNQRGFSMAGLENGVCFCDNDFRNGGRRVESAQCTTVCTGAANETCGGSFRMDVYSTAGATIPTNGVPGYSGCFSDSASMPYTAYTSDFQGPDMCKAQCSARNYTYAGLYNGQACRCSNAPPTKLVDKSACRSNLCTADSTVGCGSTSAVSVYQLDGSTMSTQPYGPLAQNGSLGCWTGRQPMIAGFSFTATNMSVQTCVSQCGAIGSTFAAIKSGTQCQCSSTEPQLNLTSGAARVQPQNCNVACPGGPGTCGGSSYIDLYDVKASGVANAALTPEGVFGCFFPGTFRSGAPYVTSIPSASLCRRTCRNKGYTYAGLSTQNTCSCSNDRAWGAVAPPITCSYPCSGNSSEICGSSTSTVIFDTAGPGSLPASGRPAGYIGCFKNDNSLSGYKLTSTSMTSASCSSVCSFRGYTVAATTGGNTCFCGSAIPAALLVDSTCSALCSGSATETCGANGYYSVYGSLPAGGNVTAAPSSTASPSLSSITVSSTSVATSSVNTGTVTSKSTGGVLIVNTTQGTNSGSRTTYGSMTSIASATATSSAIVKVQPSPATGYISRGCIQDGSPRVMNATYAVATTLTSKSCAALCAGFRFYGLENGNMCFCSDSIRSNATLALSSCDVACTGDSSTACGGTSALSLFEKVVTSSAGTATATSTSVSSSTRFTVTGTATGTVTLSKASSAQTTRSSASGTSRASSSAGTASAKPPSADVSVTATVTSTSPSSSMSSGTALSSTASASDCSASPSVVTVYRTVTLDSYNYKRSARSPFRFGRLVD